MPFTCLSCQVIFANSELQREHHKSDWHRYNLKRKVAQLPPVSAETFRNKILSQQTQTVDDNLELNCKVCHKSFSSQNAFQNHNQSKKHQENVKQTGLTGDRIVRKNENKVLSNVKQETDIDVAMDKDDLDWESCGSDDEEKAIPPIDVKECLFCDKISDNIDENLKHMTEKHSFFLPDVEFLVDLPGLIEYLVWKVTVGKICLWCRSKSFGFHTKNAVKQHMVDKGHCKMNSDDDKIMEFADFYDYSSSYPTETDQDEKMEQEIDIARLDGDEWQLVLPSGAIVGHRSLNIYYKQNVPEKKKVCLKTVNKLVSQYRALGWTGTTGDAALRKAKDIQFIEKIRHKRSLHMGMKNNKIKQTHFRKQVMF